MEKAQFFKECFRRSSHSRVWIVAAVALGSVAPALATNLSEKFVSEFDCTKFVSRISKKYDPQLEAGFARDCSAAKGMVQKDYKNIGAARYQMSEHFRSLGDRFEQEQWLYATLSISELNPKLLAYKLEAARARVRLAEQATERGDFDAAFEQYQVAAQTGHQVAKFRLGQFYMLGRGARRDYVAAYAWLSLTATYSRGAHAGEALQILNEIEGRMTPQMIGAAQKLARELDERIEEYRRQHVPSIQ